MNKMRKPLMHAMKTLLFLVAWGGVSAGAADVEQVCHKLEVPYRDVLTTRFELLCDASGKVTVAVAKMSNHSKYTVSLRKNGYRKEFWDIEILGLNNIRLTPQMKLYPVDARPPPPYPVKQISIKAGEQYEWRYPLQSVFRSDAVLEKGVAYAISFMRLAAMRVEDRPNAPWLTLTQDKDWKDGLFEVGFIEVIFVPKKPEKR